MLDRVNTWFGPGQVLVRPAGHLKARLPDAPPALGGRGARRRALALLRRHADADVGVGGDEHADIVVAGDRVVAEGDPARPDGAGRHHQEGDPGECGDRVGVLAVLGGEAAEAVRGRYVGCGLDHIDIYLKAVSCLAPSGPGGLD